MAKETMSQFCSGVSLKTRRLRTSCVITMSLYRLLLLMTVAPMVVSAATHGVNGVGINYATGALTSLLAFSLFLELQARPRPLHHACHGVLTRCLGLEAKQVPDHTQGNPAAFRTLVEEQILLLTTRPHLRSIALALHLHSTTKQQMTGSTFSEALMMAI